jgi:hypothetical protein
MSSDFKISHPGGGVTIGTRVSAANGVYWNVTIYPMRREPKTVPMTAPELAKFLKAVGMPEDFVKRIIAV